METQEKQMSALAESPAVPSIQNNEIIQVETKDDITNNRFNKFIELVNKQTKEIEEFGKQMSLNFKENLVKLNDETIKVETNSNNSIEIENVRKKFEEKIVSQSQSIENLLSRIEELETDSIIKDQDLQKFRQEFDIFKKESRLSLVTTPAQNNKKLTTNENGYNEEEKSDSRKSIDEGFAGSSTSQQSDKRIHNEIMKLLKRRKKHKDNKIKDNAFFKYLNNNSFNVGDFLEYEKSSLFNSLNNDTQRCVKLTISKFLKEELIYKKRILSQPINIYVDRELVPSLPSGVGSYNEFQNTNEFNLLSDEKKMIIKKVISAETKVNLKHI